MDFGTKNQSKILRKNTIQALLVRVVNFSIEMIQKFNVYLDQFIVVSDGERQVEVDRPLIFSHFQSAKALPFRKLED
jgi:hypothetical protein